MNKTITSKSHILQAGRHILLTQGAHALSIRCVASECNISVGSIYNYYPSKAALLSAVVQSIWFEILKPIKSTSYATFTECVQAIFKTIQAAEQQYPGFTTLHKMNFSDTEKPEGRASMKESYAILQKVLLSTLEKDTAVREDVFSGPLTQATFVGYVITLLIHLLLQRQKNCDALLAMIRQCIY